MKGKRAQRRRTMKVNYEIQLDAGETSGDDADSLDAWVEEVISATASRK